MKILLLFLAISSVCLADQITVRVIDDKGAPVLNAQVACILKSGAYQDAKLDQGDYKAQPTEECIKVFVGAPGFEAAVKKCTGAAQMVEVTLKANPAKGSTVIRKRGKLPGFDGDISPMLDSKNRLYIYATKIGLEERGKAAAQPVHFTLNHPIDAVTSTGSKFKIYVMDITPEVSLVEFTNPK